MEQPIGNQDGGSGCPAENNRADGDTDHPPQNASKLPETEKGGRRENAADCNRRSNTNCWNKFWDIAKATAELVLGIGLLTIAYWQYTVYTRQTAIMEAQQRPWIYADIKLSSWDYSPTNGADIGLTFSYRNTGGTPAVHVIPYVDARFVDRPPEALISIKEAHNEFCAKKRMEGPPNPLPPRGLTWFPSQVEPKDIDLRGDFQAKVSLPRNKLRVMPGGTLSPILVYGCINYEFALKDVPLKEGQRHQTRFMYQLQRKGAPSSISVEQGPVDVTTLELVPVGDFDAD